ncbi:MAG: hypothetical protein ACI90V_013117, partial [Bacillariaceae sp.]
CDVFRVFFCCSHNLLNLLDGHLFEENKPKIKHYKHRRSNK